MWKKPYRIYNEDCFKMFKRIPDGRIDMVLTDPPYGTTACPWDSIIPLEPMWKQLKQIVKVDGVMVMISNQPFTSKLVMSNLQMFKYCWVWDKHIPRLFQCAKYRPMSRHEDVCVFGDGRVGYSPQMVRRERAVKYRNAGSSPTISSDLKDGPHKIRTSVSRHPDTMIEGCWEANKGKVHPTQKPVALMEYLIRTYTNPGDVVLDFAMGSGTTGVACMNLDRRFVGCDDDTEHEYFEIAKNRIQAAYRKRQSSFRLDV